MDVRSTDDGKPVASFTTPLGAKEERVAVGAEWVAHASDVKLSVFRR